MKPPNHMIVSVTGTGASSVYDVTFTSVSSNISLSDTQLKITNASGSTSTYSYDKAPSGYTNGTTTYSIGSTNVAYVTGSGTYLTFSTVIKIVNLGSLSSISLIDTQTGGVIASQTNI